MAARLILFPVRRRCPSLAYAQEQLAERERQLKAAREAREKAERVEYEAAGRVVDARARVEALSQEAG